MHACARILMTFNMPRSGTTDVHPSNDRLERQVEEISCGVTIIGGRGAAPVIKETHWRMPLEDLGKR